MKLIFCISILSIAVASAFNVSVSDLNGDYLQNIFIERASKIPALPILNACQRQMIYMSKNWKTLNIFPMIDSWGKVPAGLLTGHLHAMGNFEECLNFNRKLPTPFGQLEGQYCRASIPLNPRSHQDLTETNELIHRMKENRESRLQLLSFKSGICVPKSCTLDDLSEMLPFKVTRCKSKDPTPFQTLDYVTITISSILAFFLLIGTSYDYLYRGSNKSPYLMAFSVTSNAEKLFHISNGKKKNNIDCLNGIRVLSMIWVMYGHSFTSNLMVPKINFIDYIKWTRTFFSLFTHNSFIAVDSFFFLSGLLLSWMGMKEIEKRKGRINVPLMYLHRYLRLTPMVAFIMLFIMSLLKFFGDGPLFDDFIKQGTLKCETNWWMNLLYIQNYAADQVCIPQSWYLAIDFQLFLFCPLILYVFWRWGYKSFIALAIMIALSVGCIYGTFYKYGVTGALLIIDKHVGDRMDHYYMKTHTRYSIWIIGMCFGYILYQSKDKNVKIPWYTQVLGWVVTAGVLYGVVMAPHTAIHGYKISTSTFSAATYESFSKIGWGFMMSWVVFACYHGYGGVVNSFLSNPLWQPFARISFTMYLCHIAVMCVVDGNAKTSRHFSDFDSILVFWTHLGLTVLVSIALVLAVESPIIGLEKLLLGGSSKVKPSIEAVAGTSSPSTNNVELDYKKNHQGLV